jgi:hypothetical protein
MKVITIVALLLPLALAGCVTAQVAPYRGY